MTTFLMILKNCHLIKTADGVGFIYLGGCVCGGLVLVTEEQEQAVGSRAFPRDCIQEMER